LKSDDANITSDVPQGMPQEDFSPVDSDGYPDWWKRLIAKHKTEGLKAGEFLAVEPELFKRFMDHLGKFVVHDKTAKTLIFLTGISAYTKNPLNLFLRGESSTGKTYNITQALRYFPDEDLIMLGGLSPKALVHRYGILEDRNGNLIDFSEMPSKRKPKKGKKEGQEEYNSRVEEWEQAHKAWNDKIQNARYIVDLHNKILVFLEPPSLQTYYNLRPILSHDREEISYQFTDKIGGQLRTIHVVIRGWPATIFCSTVEEYLEDLATRSFTITPETHEAKYRDAIRLQAEQEAFPWKYKEKDVEWMLLHGYIGFLKTHIPSLVICNPFVKQFATVYQATLPRSMRDFSHIRALVNTSALFHAFQRPVICRNGENYIMPSLKDLALVLKILPEIEETTITGLAQHVLDCFHKVMKPLHEEGGPFDYQTFTQRYNEVFPRKRSSSTLRKYVQVLREVGYVDTVPNPSDRRSRLIIIIKEKRDNLWESVVHEFSNSFTLKDFKSWLNDAKKYVAQNHVFLKSKITENDEANIEEVYESHYSPTILSTCFSAFFSHNFIKPSEAPIGEKPTKECVLTESTESHTISSLKDIVTDKERDEKQVTKGPIPLQKPLTNLVKADISVIRPLDPTEQGKCWGCPEKTATLTDELFLNDGSHHKLCRLCKSYVKQKLGIHEPVLTKENFEKVFNAIRTRSTISVYVTLPQIEHLTGIPQDHLKEILKIMEKEGRVFQYRPGGWKV